MNSQLKVLTAICVVACPFVVRASKDGPGARTKSNDLFVAAIDIGTSFSGWAFLLKQQSEIDPTNVFAKDWNKSLNISSKTSTAILIDSDAKAVRAFGYEADNRYAELAKDGKHESYFFFRRFKIKMVLFETKNIKRNILLMDESGKQLRAITVFSLMIRCLKEDLLKEYHKHLPDRSIVKEEEIQWVIKVPAIWNEPAKQFMREAAIKADIVPYRLTVALEPEVASIFCKYISINKLAGISGMSPKTFATGVKYIIMNAGGGTVDITVHEVLTTGRLKELHAASGGAWGGIRVDEKFDQFLTKIFRAPVMVKFKRRHMVDYIKVFQRFEVQKREVTFDNENTFLFHLPSSLLKLFKEETGENLEETIKQTLFNGTVTLKFEKLKLSAQVMRVVFYETI